GAGSRPARPRQRQDVPSPRVPVVLQIVQTSQFITTLGAPSAKPGSPITLVRGSQPCGGTLITYCRHGRTVATRPLPRQSAPLMGAFVAASREILVGSVLILIRTSLIAFTGGLVVVRPRLILITH